MLRTALAREGRTFPSTWEAHVAAGVGEVWEEDEFWIDLSWKIDPDGALGIRHYFESPTKPGEKLTLDEFYGWVFENSVPGLPEAAKAQGVTPLAYMRKYGAFLVEDRPAPTYVKELDPKLLEGAQTDPATGVIRRDGAEIGVRIDGKACAGFRTPSRKLHLGRWRLQEDMGGERWSTALVKLEQPAPGQWRMIPMHGVRPFKSADPDSERIGWQDAGVHQNLTFPVQPDPGSGQHCWHVKVWVGKPEAGRAGSHIRIARAGGAHRGPHTRSPRDGLALTAPTRTRCAGAVDSRPPARPALTA